VANIPQAGVILIAAGQIFTATTTSGGKYNYGSVFEFSASGQMTLSTAFLAGADGESPDAPLFFELPRAIFGTTFQGGNGLGTIFPR